MKKAKWWHSPTALAVYVVIAVGAIYAPEIAALCGYAELDCTSHKLKQSHHPNLVDCIDGASPSCVSHSQTGTITRTVSATMVTPVPHGWPLDASGDRLVSVAYSPTTRKVTITALEGEDPVTSFDIWVRGAKYTVASPYESSAHDATEGPWYFYHAGGGGWTWSQDFWNLHTHAPTAYVYWSSVGSTGAGYGELHGWARDIGWHVQQHRAVGTLLISGGVLGDYTLSTATDAAIQFSITEAVFVDEDNLYTATAKSDGPGYTIWRRSGTSGYWTWSTANTMPFLYGTYPQRNYDAGGGTGWTMADLVGTAGGQYLTSYVVVTPALDSTNQRFIIIPGQTAYSSLATATAESPTALSLGTLPFAEFTAVAQLVFHARQDFGGTAKAHLVAVTRLTGPKGSFTSTAAPTVHNALGGLQGGKSGEYFHTTEAENASLASIGKVMAANGDGADYLYQKMSADTTQGMYLSLEGAPPSQTVQIHHAAGSLVAGSNITISKVTATGTGTGTGTVTSLASTDTGTISVSGGGAAVTVGQGLLTETLTDSSTKISMRVPELQSVDYLMGFDGSTMSSFTLVSPGVWEHTDAIALTGSAFVESGITVNAGDRVLVAQLGTTGNTLKRCQSSSNGGISNGIFEVISPGVAGVTKPRISRDYDAMAESDFVDGMMVLVRTGGLHGGSHWRYKHFGSFTLDTDKVCFDEYGGAYDTSVKDVNVLLSDTTGNDATTDNHGFLPKLSGLSTDVMKGDGSWGPAETSQTITWALAYSVDFAAQADQTVTSNGNYTIDGKTWTTSNYASATTFTIGTTGGGVYIAHSSANTSDLGTTQTCPTLAANVVNLSSNLNPSIFTDMFVMINSVYTVAPNQNYERSVVGVTLNTADDNTPATTSWKFRMWPAQYNGTYTGSGATHIGVTTPPSSTSDVYSGTFTGGVNNTYDATGFLIHHNHSIKTFRGQMSSGNFPSIGTADWQEIAENVPVTTTYVIQGSGGLARRISVYFSVCTQGGNGANDIQVKKLSIYYRK